VKVKPSSFGIRNFGSSPSFIAAITLCIAGAASAQSQYTGLGVNPNDLNDGANWSAGFAGNINIGVTPGPTVTNTVNTPGEVWLGNGGTTGELNLGAGGTINANNWTAIGRNAGGVGVVNQSGGLYNQGNDVLIVGADGGNGTYNQTGGTITTTGSEFWIGAGGGSVGVVNSSGTIVADNWIAVGRGGGSNGTLNLNSGANFTSSGSPMIISDNGTGFLNIAPGATLTTNNQFWVGQGGSATATATQTGGNFIANSWLAIGRDNGNGTYNISGGTITQNGGDHIVIAGVGAPTGVFNVSGTAVVTATNADIWVGENGTATMNVSGNSVVSAPALRIADGGSTATLNANGGTINTQQIYGGAGASTVSFNGTQIVAQAGGGNSAFITGLGTATIGAGNLKIDSNGQVLASNQSFGGAGGVVKSGAGSLNLTANSSFAGATSVTAGTLYVNGNLSGTSGAVVATGATLAGTGTIAGSSVINGEISPGNTAGAVATLNTGAVDLAAGSTYTVDATANGINDLINASGALIANGTINILFAYTPLYGDSFDIANFASFSGSPTFTSSGLTPGDSLDTSAFSTTGVVTVIPETSSALLGLLGAACILRRRRN
jgi:Passenger-associated-transport-repeat